MDASVSPNGAAVDVAEVVKRYGDYLAVDRLTFEVGLGEVFGLLGPNGAGKTTTIRMVMDIFRPDAGRVTVLGRAPANSRSEVGYLPEDRGLYPGLRLADTLIYLAELKGAGRSEARLQADYWLDRVGLMERAGDKVQDLSRGLRQKVQLAASLVHDPKVLILDEPFQGLDPVNIELVKAIIRELAQAGKAVVLSAHQMNLVEALCDRIVLINGGRAVLYGRLDDLKRRYAPRAVRLRADNLPAVIPGVSHIEPAGEGFVLTLDGGTVPGVLRWLVTHGVDVTAYEAATTPLADLFIAAVSGHLERGDEVHAA